MHDYEAAIEEMNRILKPQGRLIILVPNEFNFTIVRFFLGRKSVKVPDHVNNFSPKIMDRAVKMRKVKSINLPFSLPFFTGLGYFAVYRK